MPPQIAEDKIFNYSGERKWVDPTTFKDEDLPLIVLTDDRTGLIGWAIKWHTKGNYGHSFIMHRPGYCVSQDFIGFKEKPIGDYMKPNLMLKFWRIKNITPQEKIIINNAISARLKDRSGIFSYDFIGTFFGQLTGLRWFQNPWQEYCSEEVNDDLIKNVKGTDIMKLKNPNPSDLDRFFTAFSDTKNPPQVTECAGYWWSD